MEKDLRTLAEKVIDGDVDIRDCDLDHDFEDYEVKMLLEKKLVRPADFWDWRAAELIIAGVLSFADIPFAEFPVDEQLDLLEGGAISEAEFRKQVRLDDFRHSWLRLVAVCPAFAADIPWDEVRRDADPHDWFAFLGRHPEFADKADWERICRDGYLSDAFDMLKKQPQLYEKLLFKDELMAADSRYWVDLIIARPEFADVYPVENLDEVDEVGELLLYRPELARRITWQEDNPPVKLFVLNSAAPFYGHYGEIRNILQESFFYPTHVAGDRTDLVTENAETFAGIFSTRSAQLMARYFRKAVREAKLPLAIRMEALDHES